MTHLFLPVGLMMVTKQSEPLSGSVSDIVLERPNVLRNLNCGEGSVTSNIDLPDWKEFP